MEKCMKKLLKIIYCGAILSQSLSAAPNWTNPVALYSTPKSSDLQQNFNAKIKGNGSAIIIYPTLFAAETFGGSAYLDTNGNITFLTSATPLTKTETPDVDRHKQRALSINNAGNALGAWIMFDDYQHPSECLQSAKLNHAAQSWEPAHMLSNVYSPLDNGAVKHYTFGTPQIYLHDGGTGVALWAEGRGNESEPSLRFNLFNGSTWVYNGFTDTTDINTQTPNYLISDVPNDSKPILLDTLMGDLTNPFTRCVYVNIYQQLHVAHLENNNEIYSWSDEYTAPSAVYANLKAASMNNAGHYALIWATGTPGSMTLTYYTSLFNAASPQPTININGTITEVAVVMNNDALPTFAYIYYDSTNTYYLVTQRWAQRDNFGSFTAPATILHQSSNVLCNVKISAMGTQGSNPVDSNVFIVWEENDINNNNHGSIYFNYFQDSANNRPDPGSGYIFTSEATNIWFYEYPQRLSNYSASCTNPQLSVNASGSAIVSWLKNNTTIEAVQTTANTYQPQTTWFECVALDQPL